jgi:hypothetical protein
LPFVAFSLSGIIVMVSIYRIYLHLQGKVIITNTLHWLILPTGVTAPAGRLKSTAGKCATACTMKLCQMDKGRHGTCHDTHGLIVIVAYPDCTGQIRSIAYEPGIM